MFFVEFTLIRNSPIGSLEHHATDGTGDTEAMLARPESVGGEKVEVDQR